MHASKIFMSYLFIFGHFIKSFLFAIFQIPKNVCLLKIQTSRRHLILCGSLARFWPLLNLNLTFWSGIIILFVFRVHFCSFFCLTENVLLWRKDKIFLGVLYDWLSFIRILSFHQYIYIYNKISSYLFI